MTSKIRVTIFEDRNSSAANSESPPVPKKNLIALTEHQIETQPMRRSVAIVWNAGYFAEYGQACSEWLKKCGWETATFDSLKGTAGYDCVVVVGISFHRYLPFNPYQFWIGVQSEQMPLEGDTDWSLHRNQSRYRGLSSYYDLIIEWSPANCLRTARPDRVRYLPYGCTPVARVPVKKKYDLLFLGNPVGSNNRRGKLLEKLKRYYSVCDRHHAWGEEKQELIQLSRVCLNLHQFDSKSFESPRMFELLAAGAFVVSEEIENSFPFTAGLHYVAFRGEQDLCNLLEHYLQSDNDRKIIALAGQKVALQYTFEQTIGQLSIEIGRLQNSQRVLMHRFVDWTLATLSMARIDLIDALAAAKRWLLKRR